MVGFVPADVFSGSVVSLIADCDIGVNLSFFRGSGVRLLTLVGGAGFGPLGVAFGALTAVLRPF